MSATRWAETLSGCRFDPFAPAPEYTATDIIFGTARRCRFQGQIRRDVDLYSVAEHQVLLYWYARRIYGDELSPRDYRTLLMHDASEGLFTEAIRPFKQDLPDVVRIERALEIDIAERFDLVYPFPVWLKSLDLRILADEREQAMSETRNHWSGLDQVERLGVVLRFWLPRLAAEVYETALREVGVLHFDRRTGPCV